MIERLLGKKLTFRKQARLDLAMPSVAQQRTEPGASALAEPLTSAHIVDVAILLCKDLTKFGNGLALQEMASFLKTAHPGAMVEALPDLCDDLGQIPTVIASMGAQRMVLGLCSSHYSQVEVQGRAKKAGLDPFAIEVIPLGTLCAAVHPGPEATRKANFLLSAAVAKIRAYEGGGPDNTRLQIMPGDERVSRRALLTMRPVGYRPVPSIKASLCAAATGCQTCVAACRHGALNQEDNRIVLDKAKCAGCGVCLVACPRNAFHFPGWSLAQIEAQLSRILNLAAQTEEPFGIVFGCRKHLRDLEDLAAKRFRYNSNRIPLAIPCVGMVTPAWTLQILANGAAAVAFPACWKDCHFKQEEAIEGNADFCQKLLRSVGDIPERVRIAGSVRTVSLSKMLREPLIAKRVTATPNPERTLRLGASVLEATAQAIRWIAGTDSPLLGTNVEHPYSPFGTLELRADACTGCLVCVQRCPNGALISNDSGDATGLAYRSSSCNGCGLCAEACPEKNSEVLRARKVTAFQTIHLERVELRADTSVRCETCGEPYASAAIVRRIKALLKDDGGLSDTLIHQCPSCRTSSPSADTSFSIRS